MVMSFDVVKMGKVLKARPVLTDSAVFARYQRMPNVGSYWDPKGLPEEE